MAYQISKDWWESKGGFFGDIYFEGDNSLEGFLHSPLDLDVRTKLEVDGVIKLCNLNPGDKLLDCPSGYGRHSIALVKRGIDVTGIDINDQELEIAQAAAKKVKLPNLKFLKIDMRNLPFKLEFNALINMFYSFGFFETEEENFNVVQKFYDALKPGGRFLMHTFITLPKIKNGDYKTHEIRTLKTGNKLELFREYNEKTKREDGQWFIIKKNGEKISSNPYSMRIYGHEEFSNLCEKAGFSKVDLYGNWDGEKYKEDSELLIVVATK